MNPSPKIIQCNICGSVETSKLVSLEFNASIFLCRNCKNAFTFPIPILPDYASEDFHANGLDTKKITKFEDLPEEIQISYNIQAQLVERNIFKNEPILEIGGGEGIFLDVLRGRGYNVEMSEPSLTAASRARERGIKVYGDYFQNIKFESTYALVNMAHVLEHIQNPLSVLEDLKMILRPKGYVMLTQTNFEGFMPRFLKKDWYAWVPSQHFSHFSIKGINYLAKKTNFKIVDYKFSRLYHGDSIYHRALKYVPFLQDQIHVLLKLKS